MSEGEAVRAAIRVACVPPVEEQYECGYQTVKISGSKRGELELTSQSGSLFGSGTTRRKLLASCLEILHKDLECGHNMAKAVDVVVRSGGLVDTIGARDVDGIASAELGSLTNEASAKLFEGICGLRAIVELIRQGAFTEEPAAKSANGKNGKSAEQPEAPEGELGRIPEIDDLVARYANTYCESIRLAAELTSEEKRLAASMKKHSLRNHFYIDGRGHEHFVDLDDRDQLTVRSSC